MTSRTLANRIANFMLSKKAQNVVIADLRKVTPTADFFVICSADSDTQVKAIADAVQEGTAGIGSPVWKYEGYQALQWVLLDFVDVVAHVFYKEARSFYNLERLWGDARLKHVSDEGEREVGRELRKTTARRHSARKKSLSARKSE
ncbi:MAG: ribosome silencing factor [Ignavibacteriales bacterium]|nr:ribosome silencing factor [Ignavibacteriales bacterium]